MILGMAGLFIALLAPPPDAIRISAELKPGALMVGQNHKFEVAASMAAGWSSKKQPPLITQLDYPACVAPVDKVLKGKELAENEFIAEPYEYLLRENGREIEFRLIAAPADGDAIGINVIGYLRGEDDDAVWFVRKRFELPLKPGAAADPADAADSKWSEPNVLQIGDKLPAISLPQADGEKVDFAEHAKGKNLVITTYRAFW
ncbi:MAG: hypothetical protein AB7N71_15100 [Phycisphaerae bacterium]